MNNHAYELILVPVVESLAWTFLGLAALRALASLAAWMIGGHGADAPEGPGALRVG